MKMRVLSVFVLVLCTGALGVQVKVGDKSFPLEAVKQLKALMDVDVNESVKAKANVVAVCRNPLLPQVFQPVCQQKEAAFVLSRLVHIITPVDPCEICAYPSCYGCM
ncbi:guanylin-like [Gouania willdenowi]|uniref:Guanylate cyclase activator 2B n=1 Tax=Gouania willdenowi TaxID=441366 RepID=A0A8C5DND6_GOUWI|nr:guanylin-like [Gouania willdenowi]